MGGVRVELSATDGRVDVWVTHPGRTRFGCPDCERELAVYDHGEERVWRHLDAGTVEFIADEPRQSSLDGYYAQFSTEQLAGIEALAMDLWEPFAASTREHLAEADSKIVFDRYHLMGYLIKAMDTVRKQENRALSAAGDKSLAGSKYLWLYS